MPDLPAASDIIQLVARYLREVALPQLSGHAAFNARVAANALDLVRRELELGPSSIAEECQRLRALLGRTDGGLSELNAELCRRIRDGEMTEAPRLAAHLWSTSLAKMAIDQPNYAAYQAALPQGPHTSDSS